LPLLPKKPEQQGVLRRQSKRILDNYIRRVAIIFLYFNALPEQINEEEINE